jgi:protein-S-isoprenylcysteine O-methyltransferase Ste14
MSKVSRFLATLLVGVVIFAGLPLIGWGIADVQGFVSHPVRLTYVVLVIVVQIFVTVRFPGAGSSRAEGAKTVNRQRQAVLLMQVFSIAIVIAAGFDDRHAVLVVSGSSDFLRYLGLVVFPIGFIMMTWAAASLGRQFSVQVTLQTDHRLVTDGLYRYLRHPRYLGIMLFNCGVALVFNSGLALLFVAALTLVLLWRIHDEEAFMRQAFGTEWETYSRTSWRLIPFVY